MQVIIKGFPRYTVDEIGTITNWKTGHILKPSKQKNGYRTVELFYAPNKSKRVLVHRLVAEAFVPNPHDYPIVNHKDESRDNNCASNLEWCTYQYNVTYGTASERRREGLKAFRQSAKIKEQAIKNGQKCSKPVVQCLTNGVPVKEYCSGAEAARQTGLNHSHIMECCQGKRYKTVGGFVWKYGGM